MSNTADSAGVTVRGANVSVSEAGVSATKLKAAFAKYGSPLTLTSSGKTVATVTRP